MRLTVAEVATIKALVARHLGGDAEVRLFGSRVDDAARGGDIDLLVTVDALPADRADIRLGVDLERALGDYLFGDRRVDLLLHVRGTEPRAVERVAYARGVVL